MTDINSFSIGVHIAQRLKERRRELNIKQYQIAEILGITPQQISKYERSADSISVSRLYCLCKILSVTPNYFFDGFDKIFLSMDEDSLWLSSENLRGQKIQMKVSGIQGTIESVKIDKESQ
ncbi:helix-turn-helix domain-containing protein [Candidatus Odyssella thessalonicensis]|uniref:helix-turn-helix domain-containing protein n=1 Tax=Candidatus Odyssella thessalonicensis TaxID=84647 RepID=UPI000225BB3A|nr:helix-turn-helix transcriptional regulator [Candidatus Odyssella thessalonicensis]